MRVKWSYFVLKTTVTNLGERSDTYPVGVDENPKRIVDILRSLQAFSNRYLKSFSVRFVSDGIAKVGDRTDFKNVYLKDVTIRPLWYIAFYNLSAAVAFCSSVGVYVQNTIK